MKRIILIFKGMAYGITHILPGLGGAIALILMGIYEPFVDAVGNLFIQRHRWREFAAFLIPLGIGMVLGILLAAVVFEKLLADHPAATNAFFVGLLVGAIPSVLRMHNDMRPSWGRTGASTLGIALVLGIRGLEAYLRAGHGQKWTLEALNQPTGVAYNGLVSFLAGGAAVTPGLDGSLVLIVGGIYEPLLQAISALKGLVIHWWPILTTAVCTVIGIFTFSKLIDTFIKRSPAVAYYGVLGMILGSIYVLVPRQPGVDSFFLLLLAFALGLGLALWLGREPTNAKSQG